MMIIKINTTYALLLLLNQLLLEISSWPTGAGSCSSGTAVSSPHIIPGQGDLSLGDFSLKINGEETSAGSTTGLLTGRMYSAELVAGTNPFKGFLFRLSGTDGTDYSDVVTVLNEDTTQTFPNSEGAECEANVGAVSHTNNTEKTFVCVGLDFRDLELGLEETTKDVTLEVTVVEENVVENSSTTGSNKWYYSSFDVRVSWDPFICDCDCDKSKNRSLRGLIKRFFF